MAESGSVGCCLKITYQIEGGDSGTFETNGIALWNDYPLYNFLIDGIEYFIWHDGVDNWYLTTSNPGDLSGIVSGIKSTIDECPLASIPTWLPNSVFTEFTTERCDPCPCLKIIVAIETGSQNYYPTISGTFNGFPTFEFSGLPIYAGTIYLWNNGGTWIFTTDGIGGVDEIAYLKSDEQCPSGKYFVTPIGSGIGIGKVEVQKTDCGCVSREDRQKFEFKSIRLPELFQEQNRGLKDCCCKYIVLAGNGNETWKNDVTSAWLKLSDPLDSVSFSLLKDGQPTIYVPTIEAFPNELNAFYTTIKWLDVIGSDGAGCYKISVDFTIAGVSGSFIWGIYDLQPYTIQNALKTARVRAIFNGVHEIDQIDFTGSNVESTHRFYGFIGFRQPNTEIDNIIFGNREMKRVIRENLNEYEIITDPEDECIIKPLIDLYLLSENELFISDYNAHNHSYRYLDLPVIVSESPSVEYKDFSRKAVLKCKVSDKFKNQRTFY